MGKFSMRGLIGTTALVVSLGMAQSALAEYVGFGDGIAVGSAARQIAPQGTDVKFAEGVDTSTPISWTSATDWKAALSDAVSKKGLKAVYSDTGVTIEKGAAPAKAAAARPYSSTPSAEMVNKPGKQRPKRAEARDPKPRATARTVQEPSVGGGGFSIRPYQQRQVEAAQTYTTSQAAAPAPTEHKLVGKDIKENDWKPVAKSDGHGQYVVESGYMLRTTLAEWASASGWTVVWDTEYDYAITSKATFQGDFIEASRQLITAMKDARPTITADFFKANKTVVISNKLADEVN